MLKIKQKVHANLEVDNREKDSVLIWSMEKGDPQVVIVSRENIDKLIKVLKGCKK